MAVPIHYRSCLVTVRMKVLQNVKLHRLQRTDWFEQHENTHQGPPWPAQSPDLNITEPL